MKQYNFVLTEEQANIALDALANEPYIKVVDTINTIQSQADEQIMEEVLEKEEKDAKEGDVQEGAEVNE